MKKIKFNELSDVKLFNRQGGSQFIIFSGTYENKEVIIKAQKSNAIIERFDRSFRALEFNFPFAVNCYGYGDDFDGMKFFVLEKLDEIIFSRLTHDQVHELVNILLLAFRIFYLKKIAWSPNLKHILQDERGNFKLIDFNDDYVNSSFFNSSYDNLIDRIKRINYDDEIMINKALDNLIRQEYESLDNVHQPIYFEKYSHFKRTETEPGDLNFGKLVEPNRVCIDRGEVLHKILEDFDKDCTCLDIGCNVGWFSFYLKDLGFSKITAIDYDVRDYTRPKIWQNGTGGKIDFAKMLSELFNSNINFINNKVDLEFVNQMHSYDIVLALSVLHLFFIQHSYNIEQWLEFFAALASKVNKVLIYEIAYIDNIFKMNCSEFMNLIKETGKFKAIIAHENKLKPERVILECLK